MIEFAGCNHFHLRYRLLLLSKSASRAEQPRVCRKQTAPIGLSTCQVCPPWRLELLPMAREFEKLDGNEDRRGRANGLLGRKFDATELVGAIGEFVLRASG